MRARIDLICILCTSTKRSQLHLHKCKGNALWSPNTVGAIYTKTSAHFQRNWQHYETYIRISLSTSTPKCFESTCTCARIIFKKRVVPSAGFKSSCPNYIQQASLCKVQDNGFNAERILWRKCMLFTLLVSNQYHSPLSYNAVSFEKEIWSVNQNGFHTKGFIF